MQYNGYWRAKPVYKVLGMSLRSARHSLLQQKSWKIQLLTELGHNKGYLLIAQQLIINRLDTTGLSKFNCIYWTHITPDNILPATYTAEQANLIAADNVIVQI